MPDHDPDVPPEQEARLRRLLAQARHRDPVPDDVAARLDRVLEQLASEGPEPHSGRSVVDLTARRRRRVTRMLVAAAAVVVVGVGVGQLTDSSLDAASDASGAASEVIAADNDASTADDGAADDGAGVASSQESETARTPESDLAPEAAPPGATTLQGAPRPAVRLSDSGFAAQALRYSGRPGVESRGSLVPGEALSRDEAFVCDSADWGEGRLLAALYDGVPAVLVYRPVAGATQTVDLLRCGTGEVLRSTVLPVER